MKLGLKGKMLLVIILLLVVSLTAVEVASITEMNKIVTSMAKTNLVAESDKINERIDAFFEKREILLENEVHNIKHLFEESSGDYSLSDEELKNHLVDHTKELSDEYEIINYYVGYPDGKFYCGNGWVPDPDWKANERPWYIKAVDSVGNIVQTDIYIDSITKMTVISLSEAITDISGNVIAVVGFDIGLKQLEELFKGEKIGENGYSFLISGDGRFIVHPVYKYNEKIEEADTIYNISNGSLKEISKKLMIETNETIRGDFNGVHKIYYSKLIKNFNFYLISGLTEEDFTNEILDFTKKSALIMIVSVLFFVVFIFLFIGRITKIIKKIVNGMHQISKGDLTYQIEKIKRKDELGVLSSSMEAMQDSMKKIINAIKLETNNVNAAIDISTSNILSLSDDIKAVSLSAEVLSAGMEETAASTEEMNATAFEIEHAIENISEKAQDGALSANEISKKADSLKHMSLELQNEANETRTIIKTDMEAALNKISAVDRINTLSEAILQIASQTNLLALNAAIESARAGEAGKGFAVVADEIRKLAEDSKTTVNEIRKTVEDVYQAVHNLVDISKYTISYIESKVVESYKGSVVVAETYNGDAEYVNGLVMDLSATSEELLASIKTVVMTTNEIARANNDGAEGTNIIAQKVSSIKGKSDEINSQAVAVKNSADNLLDLVSNFKL